MRTSVAFCLHALSCAVAALAVGVAPCHAAGLWLPESGGADMGMAGAGRAALGLDGSSLASNPATMVALPAGTVTASVMPLSLGFDFRGSTETPGTTTNQEGVTAIPALYTIRRSDRWAYGIGAYSYLGLSFDAGPQWVGRRIIEQAALSTFNVAPAVAWHATDRWSVGASVAGQWARPEMRLAVASEAAYYGPPAGMPDGQLQLNGDSWSIGGQLGVLYDAGHGMRAGVAWTAPVEHSAALDLEADGLHPTLAALLPADGSARVNFSIPQQVLFGLSRRTNHGTTLALGLSWQDWSRFGASRLDLPGQSAPLFVDGLQDTWGASIGVRRSLGAGWSASAGIGYESSPATDRGVPAYFPVAEQWRIAAGAERRISDTMRVRAELSAVRQGDARVVQSTYPLPLPGVPTLTGRYENTSIYAVALAADFGN